MKGELDTAAFAVGCLLLIAASALVYVPAGLFLAGLLVCAASVVLGRLPKKGRRR